MEGGGYSPGGGKSLPSSADDVGHSSNIDALTMELDGSFFRPLYSYYTSTLDPPLTHSIVPLSMRERERER